MGVFGTGGWDKKPNARQRKAAKKVADFRRGKAVSGRAAAQHTDKAWSRYDVSQRRKSR